ncbi:MULTISPECIES: GntR family transcriptional regulator [unclassified Microbacterium]|uniref:GntR family transcriptional regulator n=1 Tax=unclassified Microbacterium TaxID=2609290 RepID=UPI0039C9BE0E
MSASERAHAALLDDIQSGVLPAGSVLGEVEQAARLGVSRTPLREALRRLAADGLVVQQSPRVTVVADLDASDIRKLFEIRRALEETSARLAAQRGDAELFAALAEEFAHVDLAADVGRDDYYALIARFDAALDAAVANDYIASALRTVRTHLVRVRRMAKDKPARLAASASEHRTIAQALAARDGDLAAHATHVHLHNALTGILESLDAVGEGVSTRSARSTTGAGEGVSSLRLAPLTQHGARSARSTTTTSDE